MLRVNGRGVLLTSTVAFVLVLLFVARWKREDLSAWQTQLTSSPATEEIIVPVSTPDVNSDAPDLSAGNSTLGFQSILALSQGTKWRVDGLHAAASVSNITITIPPQPKWSEPFITAFKAFGPVEAHGAALAWLGHLDLLKFVIQNNWGSALILEDDMDWDVEIRRQTPGIAAAVRKLTKQKERMGLPYGDAWDIMWLGHCSDPPPFPDEGKIIYFADNTTAPISSYRGLNPRVKDVLQDNQRAVHYSINPVCTFGYAVSHSGARKLLAHASLGQGGAFDLMLMHACKDKVLKCVSVNPEVFDPYNTAEGGTSEVRAGDSGLEFDKEAGKEMGHTDNILRSARCFSLFGTTCLT